jgi:hypothetical protein
VNGLLQLDNGNLRKTIVADVDRVDGPIPLRVLLVNHAGGIEEVGHEVLVGIPIRQGSLFGLVIKPE